MWLRRFRQCVLLILILGMPTFFLWSITFDAFNVPKLALLSAGVSLAVTVRAIEFGLGRTHADLRSLLIPASLLAGPLLVSWLLTPNKRWTLLGEYQRFEGLIPYLLIVIAGLLIADAFAGRGLLLAWTWVLGGTVVGAYALLQALGYDPLNLPLDPYLAATIGHGNFVGGFLAVTLPVAMTIWVGGMRGGRLAAIATILISVGLILSLSQGGWAAGVAGVAVALGQLMRRRFKFGPVLGYAIALLVALAILGNVVLAALSPDNALVGGTTRARAEWWKSAATMGAESPLWGHGPNAYALESPQHRTIIDALGHGNLLSNAPHSVPFSFFANTGFLGLLGFVGILWWAWQKRPRSPKEDLLLGGFLAAVVAYAVQSLVSLDELLLAFALWVGLAGMAACAPARNVVAKKRPSIVVTGTVMATAVALTIVGVGFSVRLIQADVSALKGARSLNAGDITLGREQLDEALDRVDLVAYRFTYGARLGNAALDRGARGRPLVEEMRTVFAPASEMGHLHSIFSEARTLQLWSVHDASYRLEALRLLRQATTLDPFNPEVKLWLAETLMSLGRSEETEMEIQRFVSDVMAKQPGIQNFTAPLWSVLAIAQHDLEKYEEAAGSLARALDAAATNGTTTSNCAVVIARVVVGGEEDLERIPEALSCPEAVRDALNPKSLTGE